MANRLRTQHLSAELATLDQLLSTLSPDDVLGRISFESRKRDVSRELEQLTGNPEQQASVALFFGGQPVIGSAGIQANFAAAAVEEFQGLVTNIWASEDGEVGRRGPVERRDESILHITSLLHGSVGFLLEEMDEQGRIDPSPLKRASERAAQIVSAFTSEDDEVFRAMLEEVDNRVLGSTREFLRKLYSNHATLRLVEGEQELALDFPAVEKAYERAENATIEDADEPITGVLLGLIPYGRKFEIRLDTGELVSGSVAPTLSEAYLQRLRDEKLVGQECQGRIHRKRITRFGRVTESILLLDLMPAENPENPTTTQR